MAGFLIALLSGALMSVQGVVITLGTKSTGIWVNQSQLYGRSDRIICCWEE